MKNFIEEKIREGRFSTRSEYIPSLIRDDHDMTGNNDIALLIPRGVLVDGSREGTRPTAAATSRRRK